YLRLLQSRADDAAFERIVNTPARGIGNTTLARIRDHARGAGISMWQAAGEMASSGLPARAAKAVHAFIALIDDLDAAIAALSLPEAAEHVIATTQLKAHHGKDKSEKGQARTENLDVVVSAARGYTPDDDDSMTPMTQFLAYASLEA